MNVVLLETEKGMKSKTTPKEELKSKTPVVKKGRPRIPAPEPGTETKYTAFRCPLDVLAFAKIKAKKQRRSLSNYIITLIERETRETEDQAAA
ncbi:MAG: hypothetical protein JWL59_58 [Chthoniobacteraceae bacterium]|nr:hypothetical protein [Chthoniobacteraceae bacterium]